MNVTGYLALYTTLLGWQQYQNLWNLVTGTGLAYLPFVGIFLRSTLEPLLSMGAKDFSVIAVRRLVVHVLAALFVVAVACVPCMRLNPAVLHFEPTCQPQAQEATPGNTGTTYDNAFEVPTGVKIPLIWYLVMAVSNGFTHAATVGLSCAPVNYRELHAELDLATIQSAALKQSVMNFYRECYIPAYDTFLGGNLSPSQQAQIAALEKQYGHQDVGWLGSQIFLTVPGFYDSLQATQPVSGFLFDPTRDQTEGQVATHSQWGEPLCSDWWSDPASGLKNQLWQQFTPSFMESIVHFGDSAPRLEDAAIRHLIRYNVFYSPAGPSNEQLRGYASLNDSDSALSQGVFGSLQEAGVAMTSLVGFTTIHLIINALPIMQAVLLFFLYLFLALAIPLSGYKPSFVVTASVIMFAMIFCAYIWHLVAWLDDHLISALFPGSNALQIGLDVLGQTQHSLSEVFVNLLIGALYLVCPVFFMVVLSWAGLKAGAVFGAILSPMSGAAQSAGQASTKALKMLAAKG